MGWNYLSIPKHQRLQCQNWELVRNFITHLTMDAFIHVGIEVNPSRKRRLWYNIDLQINGWFTLIITHFNCIITFLDNSFVLHQYQIQVNQAHNILKISTYNIIGIGESIINLSIISSEAALVIKNNTQPDKRLDSKPDNYKHQWLLLFTMASYNMCSQWKPYPTADNKLKLFW